MFLSQRILAEETFERKMIEVINFFFYDTNRLNWECLIIKFKNILNQKFMMVAKRGIIIIVEFMVSFFYFLLY